MIIDQALQALRTGDVDTAIRAIESAPAAAREHHGAAQRTLAAAQAQRGDLTAADAAIQRAALSTVEPATRALAGRMALDRKQPEQAFQHFEALVQLLATADGVLALPVGRSDHAAVATTCAATGPCASLDASADVHVARATTRALADTGAVAEALTLGVTRQCDIRNQTPRAGSGCDGWWMRHHLMPWRELQSAAGPCAGRLPRGRRSTPTPSMPR